MDRHPPEGRQGPGVRFLSPVLDQESQQNFSRTSVELQQNIRLQSVTRLSINPESDPLPSFHFPLCSHRFPQSDQICNKYMKQLISINTDRQCGRNNLLLKKEKKAEEVLVTVKWLRDNRFHTRRRLL